MLQPSKIAPGFEQHEELFLERYKQLRAWASQLTENDRAQAEDLVHDTYIQFTLTRPDLSAIGNLNGYLYTMMRNLYVSQLRRSQRQQHRTLSIIDYDSAEMGLRTADPREQIKLQDALRQICQYACMRKQTSKAGSVLILRFLHGYYPREIAQVTLSTRQAVEERLRTARNEARQYLQNPKSLRFMSEESTETMQVPRMGFAQSTDRLLSELRQTIFDSRQGDCYTGRQLEQLYHEDEHPVIDSLLLAHLVSCPQCLDQVNLTLNLPLLQERFTTDTLGTDTRSKGGDSGGGDGGGGDGSGGSTGGASEMERRECRRQAGAVSEHRPAELCISINGYLMAAQKVGSELTEQTISINVAEKIDFVEVFSEQDVRLLFLSVEDLAKEIHKRTAYVQLSDGRSLEATLNSGNPWPTLQVVYSDPLMCNESASEDIAAESNALRGLAPVADLQNEESSEEPGISKTPHSLTRLWRLVGSPGFWLRPGMVTVVVALILVAALLMTRLHVPTVSAAELLRRSATADEAASGNPELVLHRTINLEERRVNGGDLVAQHRIEIWQSAAHGVKLRRVYDHQGTLIAGELTRSNGTSTVYQRGAEPQARTSPEIAAKAILQTKELWRLDASARDFNHLVGGPETITVAETSTTFVLSYQSDPVSGSNGLLGATLTLNRTDLHAIDQTLTILRDGEAHAYRFIEAGFERKATDSVAPGLLQPEPELLGSSAQVKEGADRKGVWADDSQAPASIAGPTAALASVELEIEVTYLLNQIKANLGEQVNLTRTTSGTLRVEALVETESRKAEILNALGPVINNPAIKVEVSTVDEAVKRQQKRSAPGEATVREVEVRNNRIPADPQLRSYFSARLVGSQAIDEEIQRYANRAMNRSRQALLQASALKRLVGRFSSEEIRVLTPEARTKWLAMIGEHAQAYRREVRALRIELGPIFGGVDGSRMSTEQAFGSEASLTRLADRLVQLSYANDEAVRSAFTISAEGHTAASIKSPEFWRALTNAEALAAAIQGVYQK